MERTEFERIPPQDVLKMLAEQKALEIEWVLTVLQEETTGRKLFSEQDITNVVDRLLDRRQDHIDELETWNE